MPNKGAWTNTPTTKGKVTIPAGYHNGSGYVDVSKVYENATNIIEIIKNAGHAGGANSAGSSFSASTNIQLSPGKYIITSVCSHVTNRMADSAVHGYSGCRVPPLPSGCTELSNVNNEYAVIEVTQTVTISDTYTFSGFANAGGTGGSIHIIACKFN